MSGFERGACKRTATIIPKSLVVLTRAQGDVAKDFSMKSILNLLSYVFVIYCNILLLYICYISINNIILKHINNQK